MKKRIIIITSITLIGLILIFTFVKPKTDTWKYNLINNYILEKKSDTSYIIIDNNKKEIINDYIAEINYGKKYLSLKCAKNENDSIIVYFYIIDTINNKLYGPYNDEESYNKDKEELVQEKTTNWLKTSNLTK